MKRVLVTEIEPGMLLEKEVYGPSGSILLNRGTPLSPALGARLKNWGIDFVYIEGETDDDAAADSDSLQPLEYKVHLEKKFSRCLNNHIMRQIFAAVYQFKVKTQ